jgi:hypothetical protein
LLEQAPPRIASAATHGNGKRLGVIGSPGVASRRFKE